MKIILSLLLLGPLFTLRAMDYTCDSVISYGETQMGFSDWKWSLEGGLHQNDATYDATKINELLFEREGEVFFKTEFKNIHNGQTIQLLHKATETLHFKNITDEFSYKRVCREI